MPSLSHPPGLGRPGQSQIYALRQVFHPAFWPFADQIQRVVAGWQPLRRVLALAALHVGFFMGVCAISYLQLPLGDQIAAALFVVSALLSPLSGLLLLLIAIIFQYLFWFAPGDFYEIIGALSVAYMVRLFPIIVKEGLRSSPQSIALLVFIAIVFLHFSAANDWNTILTAIGFLSLAATIFLHTRSIARKTEMVSVVVATVCLTGLIAGVMSFVYLYVPLPALFLSHSPLSIIDLRLVGAQDNANGMAARLLPASISVFLVMFLRRRPLALWCIAFAATVLLATATGTKSLMLALLVIAVILMCLALKKDILKWWCAVSVASAALIFLFLAGLFPLLQAHAAHSWRDFGEPSMDVARYDQLASKSLFESLSPVLLLKTARAELRIANVVEHPKIVGTRRVWTAVPHADDESFEERLVQTGERLRLLKAGLQVVASHPWWGIGHKQWPVVMQKRLDYPFLSPHNGFLETWGSYGVLGALLYIAVIVLAVRNYWVIEKNAKDSDPWTIWLNRGIAFFLLATFLREMVDVSTVLAVTPIALWAWAALGLQDGLARHKDQSVGK